MDSKNISVTLPKSMLVAIDKLALHRFNSRSGVIREAVAEFLSRPENSYIANPKEEAMALKYEILKEKHPSLSPNDDFMIDFLFEQRNADKDEI